MVLAMARPHRRHGIFQFRRRVPARLRPLVGKGEIKRSLHTRDSRVAPGRHRAVAAEIEAEWARLEAAAEPAAATATAAADPPARELSPREVAAIAGEFYARIVEAFADEPGRPEFWERKLREDPPAPAQAASPGPGRGGPEPSVRTDDTGVIDCDVRQLLAQHGRTADPVALDRLRAEALKAQHLAYALLRRQADGDFSPDPNANRFPPWPKAGGRLDEIWEAWLEEAKPSPRTRRRWRGVLDRFIEHLGTDDLAKATKADVIAWKDALVAEGLKRSTIVKVNLQALRTVCAWAKANDRLGINPAAEVRLAKGRQSKVRDRGFTLAEAEAILAGTLAPASRRLSPEHRAARRWVPWLCAYNGARINEMTQLRGRDVFPLEIEGRTAWMVRITPEAGSVKTSTFREVPLHPHLIEQGFLDFVRETGPGPLFYDPSRSRGGREPMYAHMGGKLAKWVRQTIGIRDRNIDPNHAWRHRFPTVAEAVGIPERVYNQIQGHAPTSAGRKYGVVPPETLVEAICRIPRYAVSGVNGQSP